MNFRSNYSWNWTNYELDYPQCHPLRSPSNIQSDVASFGVSRMDLCLHAVVVFVVVAISVVLAAVAIKVDAIVFVFILCV